VAPLSAELLSWTKPMPSTYNMHEAKTQLSRLAERAANGEEIVIARNGKPLARLVPVAEHRPRQLGFWAGRVRVGEDFDEPLPEDMRAAFEGRGD
jgi:prevent-host-death family protein